MKKEKKEHISRRAATLLILCLMMGGCDGSCAKDIYYKITGKPVYTIQNDASAETTASDAVQTENTKKQLEETATPTITPTPTFTPTPLPTDTPTPTPHMCEYTKITESETKAECEKCGEEYVITRITRYECPKCGEYKERRDEYVHVCAVTPTPTAVPVNEADDHVWTKYDTEVWHEVSKKLLLTTIAEDTKLHRIGILADESMSLIEYKGYTGYVETSSVSTVAPTPTPAPTPTLTPTPSPKPTNTPKPTATPIPTARPTATIIPELKGRELKTTTKETKDGGLAVIETKTTYGSGMSETIVVTNDPSDSSYGEVIRDIVTMPDGTRYVTYPYAEEYFNDMEMMIQYPDGTYKFWNTETGDIEYRDANDKVIWKVKRWDDLYGLPEKFNSQPFYFYYRYTTTKEDVVLCNSDGSDNEWSGTHLDIESGYRYGAATIFWGTDHLEHKYPDADGPFYDY